MENIFSNITPEVIAGILINFLFILILFFMNISTRSKLKKLKAKYTKFMSGISSENNIESLLELCISKVNEVGNKNREMENEINFIQRNLMQCIQKIGIVRFNAFDNVGSDLSFAIALLDNNDNGIVLSGIYSRDSSSTYAKPIANGKSKYALSAEELQSIDIAKKIFREKPEK